MDILKTLELAAEIAFALGLIVSALDAAKLIPHEPASKIGKFLAGFSAFRSKK